MPIDEVAMLLQVRTSVLKEAVRHGKAIKGKTAPVARDVTDRGVMYFDGSVIKEWLGV
ncbi:hypothetical protein [Photobacterium halotolerans]|uniref:hypothetical protein n=1 Tax=Photobacterium halotolerans TaxID=265726 RepID=UPI0012DFA48F|nr:hypothetical protein [Photobacterium halotolerans]